jgi:transcriptional regulator with XRE-family HTH domain
MKLGEVLKKERERKRLTVEDVARRLGLSAERYTELEAGESPAEEWGPRLALVAIALKTPTSRLIATTGKSAQARQEEGQCGKLIRFHRDKRELSQKDLAESVGVSEEDLEAIEAGRTELETYAPLLLGFAEVIDQPIFNLFYPCGLPLAELTDYP